MRLLAIAALALTGAACVPVVAEAPPVIVLGTCDGQTYTVEEWTQYLRCERGQRPVRTP